MIVSIYNSQFKLPTYVCMYIEHPLAWHVCMVPTYYEVENK